tara:strand:- start:6111 stop:6392 length:282 start_codon:yes stop_codon:yes gene_type:complete
MLDRKILDRIIKEYKGKSGGPEAESILVDNKEEAKDGIIEVYAMGKDAAKIAERCWPAIVKVKFEGEACFLTIKRSAFRGLHTAFKIVKEDKC